MEKQDDWTRFQLCRFYCHTNDWFLWDQVNNLESKEGKKKFTTAAKKSKEKKVTKKQKWTDSFSCVVESSKESSGERQSKREILHSAWWMQPFCRQVQGSTCYVIQAQTEEKEKLSILQKVQQGAERPNWKEILEIWWKTKKKKDKKKSSNISRNYRFYTIKVNKWL